jgi:RimJ/RimL family protein N-acetyltransferase
MEFENYKFRIIEKEDTKSYFDLIDNNRPRLEDFISGIVSKTKSIHDTEVFIDEIIEKNLSETYYPYVIIDTANHELVGFFDVKNIDWNIPKAEIGYFIDKNHTGKGIAKKALNEIVSHFFSNLKFSKFLLRIHYDNKASINVAEKCGFTKEGTSRKDYKKTNGEIVDMMYYGKINN